MDARQIIKDISEDSLSIKREFFSDDQNINTVMSAAAALIRCYQAGGKVIVCGNGGSAADSQHLAAELMIRFEKERRGFSCIALTTNTSILTAAANDYAFEKVFSRQIEALADSADAVVVISTSGNSKNVLEAARAARKKKSQVIALTGNNGGKLVEESDISIIVKEKNTARVQEVHITIIHIICKIIEDTLIS